MATEDTKMNAVGCMACVFILLLGIVVQSCLYREVRTGTFRCIKTYTVTTGGRDSISTSKRVDLKPVGGGNTETMRVDDALALGQWNSATIYANFEVGKTYRITARGPRNPVFSMFPNVTEATEIAE